MNADTAQQPRQQRLQTSGVSTQKNGKEVGIEQFRPPDGEKIIL
jgi:hypothetical protein